MRRMFDEGAAVSRRTRGLVDEFRLLRHGRDWRGRARVPRSAQRFEPRDEGQEFPTAWARTAAVGVLRTALQRGILKPLTWSQTRPVVYGREYLDAVHSPAIFVANHSSHLDTPLILGALPPRITERLAVGAAADYFFASRIWATLTPLVFNTFPVERRGGRRGRSRARNMAAELVEDGWSLLLYPEGSRTPDGWLRAFKLGAAQLCVTRQIPAVPIALRGTFQAMPRGSRWPRPGRPRVSVRIGRPLWAEPDEGAAQFRNRLARAVATLWAEEDLDWYRSLRAAADGTLELPTDPDAREIAGWRRIWEATRPPRERGPAQPWSSR